MEEALIPYVWGKTTSLFNDSIEAKFLLAILSGVIFSDLITHKFIPRIEEGNLKALVFNYGLRYLMYVFITLTIMFILVLALNSIRWLGSL